MTHTLTLHSPTNTIRATLVIEDGERVEVDGELVWPKLAPISPLVVEWPEPPSFSDEDARLVFGTDDEPEIETCSYGDAMRAMREKLQRVEVKLDGEWLTARSEGVRVFVDEQHDNGSCHAIDIAEAQAWRIVEQPIPVEVDAKLVEIVESYGNSIDRTKPSNGGNGAGGCEVWEGDKS